MDRLALDIVELALREKQDGKKKEEGRDKVLVSSCVRWNQGEKRRLCAMSLGGMEGIYLP